MNNSPILSLSFLPNPKRLALRLARGGAALGFVCLALCGAAMAAPIAVVNPGFEDISGEAPFNEFTFGPLTGWNLHDPGNVTDGGDGSAYFIGTLTPQPDPGNSGSFRNFASGAAEGQRVGIAFNFQDSGGGGEYGFEQTLAIPLAANSDYVLRVEIGNIASGFALSGDFFDLDGFPGYRVDLLAGGVVIAQDNNSLFGTIPEGQFRTSTVNFTTSASHPQLGLNLGIRLVNLNQIDSAFTDSDLEVDFDNVRFEVALVPEPSVPVLLGFAASAFLLRRRAR